MSSRAGWSLIELLVVIAIIALLCVVLGPAMSRARDIATLAVCAAQMHELHIALMCYAGTHGRLMPPFAFSDARATSLPLSGHWGGASQPGDPAAFGRLGVGCVNLWSLVRDGLSPPEQALCPAARGQLFAGKTGYFPHTTRYSTYCLRMPASADLFSDAPATWDRYGLGIYALAGGGQTSPVKRQDPLGAVAFETIPQTRVGGIYETLAEASAGDGRCDMGGDVILSDAFWYQDHRAAAAELPGLQAFSVRASWCHGRRFNTLRGNGAVHAVADDGTVASATVPPGGRAVADALHNAARAERVWEYFDAAR